MNRNTTQQAPLAHPLSSERGAALLLALFVLSTLALIAMVVVASTMVNRRMAGDEVTRLKALRYAEAGVAEALNRIQNNLGPNPSAASPARKVVQILNTAAPGVAGADTTLLSTGQPAGSYLDYSTSTKGNGALTVEFETDAAHTKVYVYNKTLIPPMQFTSGDTVYRITATGTVGPVTRRLVVDAIKPRTTLSLLGAVVSGVDVKYTGSGVDCGFNHLATTPYPSGQISRTGAGGCDVWEAGSGDVAGTYTYGTFTKTGPSFDYGSPPVISGAGGAFYAGPWQIFGITPAQFWAWVGPRVSSLPNPPNGVYYVDNDATKQNQSGNFTYAGATTGTGFLYIDGNLSLNNNFHFKGLVYVEGTFKATNDAWILGAVVTRGQTGVRTDLTGPNTFLYSSDVIMSLPGNPIAGLSNKVKVLSWKEQ